MPNQTTQDYINHVNEIYEKITKELMAQDKSYTDVNSATGYDVPLLVAPELKGTSEAEIADYNEQMLAFREKISGKHMWIAVYLEEISEHINENISQDSIAIDQKIIAFDQFADDAIKKINQKGSYKFSSSSPKVAVKPDSTVTNNEIKEFLNDVNKAYLEVANQLIKNRLLTAEQLETMPSIDDLIIADKSESNMKEDSVTAYIEAMNKWSSSISNPRVASEFNNMNVRIRPVLREVQELNKNPPKNLTDQLPLKLNEIKKRMNRSLTVTMEDKYNSNYKFTLQKVTPTSASIDSTSVISERSVTQFVRDDITRIFREIAKDLKVDLTNAPSDPNELGKWLENNTTLTPLQGAKIGDLRIKVNDMIKEIAYTDNKILDPTLRQKYFNDQKNTFQKYINRSVGLILGEDNRGKYALTALPQLPASPAQLNEQYKQAIIECLFHDQIPKGQTQLKDDQIVKLSSYHVRNTETNAEFITKFENKFNKLESDKQKEILKKLGVSDIKDAGPNLQKGRLHINDMVKNSELNKKTVEPEVKESKQHMFSTAFNYIKEGAKATKKQIKDAAKEAKENVKDAMRWNKSGKP